MHVLPVLTGAQKLEKDCCHTVHQPEFGCHEAVERVRQCIKAPEVQVPVAQHKYALGSAAQSSAVATMAKAAAFWPPGLLDSSTSGRVSKFKDS